MKIATASLRALAAIIALLVAGVLNLQPAQADSGGFFSAYYTLTYNLHQSQTQVYQGQTFYADCAATMTCVATPPINITSAEMIGRLVATKGGIAEVLLDNYVVNCIPPTTPGASVSDSDALSLVFPPGSPPGDYILTAELESAHIDTDAGSIGITDMLPPSQVVGAISLIASGSYVDLTYPDGGETLATGSQCDILWNSAGISGVLKIELLKGGAPVKTINSQARVSLGRYSWSIPSNQAWGDDYAIRLTSTTNIAIKDTSHLPFSIVPPPPPEVSITQPVTGQICTAGANCVITWTSVSLLGNLKVELLQAGVPIKIITSSPRASAGKVTWKIPSKTFTASNYAIRLTSKTYPSVTDTSGLFTINGLAPPAITLTAPNGGETWTVGSSQWIRWADVNVDGWCTLELLKGGTVVKTITARTSETTNKYNWKVPSLAPGSDYTIRITSLTYTGVTDTSDLPFTIK